MHEQTRGNLVISGANGFVGAAAAEAGDSAVTAGLLGGVRRMVRDPSSAGVDGVVVADLTDRRSLVAAFSGADSLVHAAGYRGSDPVLQQRMNVDGTRAVVEAAEEAGVRRIVLVSTTAVYGSGPHRGEPEGRLPVHPESLLTESRLAAEEIVLAAGGIVVRPDLTYGPGDRWVVPALVRVNRMLGGLIDGGSALTSAIEVRELGRLLVDVATAHDEPQQRVFHAAAHPVPLSALLDAVSGPLGLRLPTGAPARAEATPILTDAGLSPHQLDLIASDHWYDGSALRALAGRSAPAAPAIDARAADWYASVLAAR
ncbi:NAD-dependent epimerase/dehydratase family protein [Leifsonia sp. NPDC058292]|uniref:NAD-dependent epimerase/dehydratase family protein n=1 Tax=Leifsonia sp. NPDC058292 TaxID=3346428 RepID=UPI0036DE3A95